MDVMKTVREIGCFEAARNMSEALDSEMVRRKVEEDMPMPDAGFEASIERAADWLMSFGKSKIMLLSPEIAIIEALAQRAGDDHEVIIMIPSDMDPESKQRLGNNIPKGISVELIEESFFPQGFIPKNGLIAAFGYTGADRLMVLPETYRLVEDYGRFWGKKVFVPYKACGSFVRTGEWTEIRKSRFSDVWEDRRSAGQDISIQEERRWKVL